jgi:hypothetical protein
MPLQQNIVSYNNSSTTVLAANATFTGVFENVLQYQEISCFCVSDVGGTLWLDLSIDGVTSTASYSFVSTGSIFFRAPSNEPYARIRYINGGTIQTQFALTTIYRPVVGAVAQLPITSSFFDASLASTERAILFGKNASGTYVQIPADTDTGLRVTSSLGTTLNKTQVQKTGTLVTTATTVDQVILTYTVTAGKTLYLTYLEIIGAQTTPTGGTNVVLGTISLETPSGTKVLQKRCVGGGGVLPDGLIFAFGEPLFIAAGVVVRAVVTPAATSSFTWTANFGGYEK